MHVLLKLIVVALLLIVTRPTLAQNTRPTDPAVDALLARVTTAYRDAKTLRLEATTTGDYDVGGRVVNHEVKIASARAAAGRFRSEAAGELVVAATADGVFVYVPAALRYYKADPLGEAVTPTTLGDAATNALLEADPSLLLSLVQDPAALLKSLGTLGVEGDNDLTVARPDESRWTLRFDPQTSLLREVVADDSATFTAAGVPDVRRATRTTRYSVVEPNADVAADAVAFVPPETAQQVEPGAAVATGDVEGLAGKPAPALALKDLAGNAVTLAQFKGRVVVIDFWATWCPPCRAGIPHLTEMARTLDKEGVTVLAVNVQEAADAVRQFAADNGMTADAMKVLLDADGAVTAAWGVGAYPTTVVVGRDGVVRKTLVGLQPAELDAAVKAALAE